MWFLTRSTNPGVNQFGLLPGREYTVGRKDCHILLSTDQSISRNHAKLTVSSPPTAGGATPTVLSPTVTLTDLSKFGTRVNGCKVERTGSGLAVVELKNGEEVKFGGTPASTVFRLQWSPVVVCCSGMKPSEQKRVRQLVQGLGGSVVPQWTKECSCLVMTKLTVTQKVISALSCCKPVVTADWLEVLVKCCKQQKQLPDPARHLPPITDQNVEKDPTIFYPDPARRTIFKGKVLCFLSKQQCANYELCITMSGGICKFLEPQSVRPASLTLSPSCMVVSVEESEARRMRGEDKEWVEGVFQRVKQEGFRRIHETEIVRAVLYRNTAEYCNPASQAVPVGVPLAPPTLSQTSSLGTQHTQPALSDTQLHSQASLLVERRDANTSCSFPSKVQAVKEEREEEDMFRAPPPLAPPSAPPQGVSSTDAPAWKTIDLSSSGGDESMERRGSVLAPSSVPADSSLDESTRLTSASFVAGLFPRQKKGKRSFGEVDDSPDCLEASSAKKSVYRDQSVDSKGEACDSDSLRTDNPIFYDSLKHVRSPPKQLPTGDVDVFSFRKRKSSQSPQDGRQDVRRKLLRTSSTDDAGVAKDDARDVSFSQTDASRARLYMPTNNPLVRNTATRRPRRFTALPTLPPQQFISTRKSSAAFYHPPIVTDSNNSRILSCSYREVLQDVTASQLMTGSYNEEASDGEGEDGDGSLPILECPVVPLVKRQETKGEPQFGKEGEPVSVRNYKLFRKVQGPQSGHLPSTSSPINLEVYRKPEDTLVLAGLQGCFGESDQEEQEGGSEEENPFVFQTKRK